MSSLIEFLNARIAEDEELARRNSGDRGVGDTGFWPDYVTFDDGPNYPAAVAYLHQFNPARVLVECAAKRAIIEYSDRGGWRDPVAVLAAVYRSHPNFDPRWAQQ